MNNCKAIHETIIRDIIDIGTDLKDSDALKLFNGRKNSHRSIASSSSNLIMVFPVLCSKTIGIENAGMISKAIERKATSMLNLLFTATQIHHTDDVYDYLSKFHTNLKIDNNITVDGMMDLLDTHVIGESSFSGTDYILNEKRQMKSLQADKRNLGFYLESNLSETSISDFDIIPAGRYGKMTIIESDDLSPMEKERSSHARQKNTRDQTKLDLDIRKDAREREKLELDTRKSNIDSQNLNLSARRDNRDEKRYHDDRNSKKYNTGNEIKKFFTQNNLQDNDVKKSNELVSTVLTVNYFVKDGDTYIPISILAGVKAKLYPIESTDIIERLTTKNKNSNSLQKFIRATTREISFVKDFLFAIDQTKVDAISQSRRGSSSKLWKILERRATKSKLRRRLGMKNDASAITTMVVSQAEIEYIKKEHNIDLENPKEVRAVLEGYNFLCFCIVDEINEVAKFLFDTGEDLYENISFNNLERESSDGGYKKVINLMSKMQR